MSETRDGELRASQVISTYGPGALLDLPTASAIVAGLESWPKPSSLVQIVEPRLTSKVRKATGVHNAVLYAPPTVTFEKGKSSPGIQAWRFPQWFLVHEKESLGQNERSRRLVHQGALDSRGRFGGREVVAIRFVRACSKGHIDDVDWPGFVHAPGKSCGRQLWLDERGTSGDLSELVVRCECGASKGLSAATRTGSETALGSCSGQRPWLGPWAREQCGQPSRLLVRTATNAYFPQIITVLSLPDRGTEIDKAVNDHWNILQVVTEPSQLQTFLAIPEIGHLKERFPEADLLKAIKRRRQGSAEDRPVKIVELDAILAAPEGFGDDIPVDPDFHARRLPDHVWRKDQRWSGVKAVIQVHRLREVRALIGFSRFDPIVPDIDGEFDSDVERAQIAEDPSWFPAIENRGEGIFLLMDADEVERWLAQERVAERLRSLRAGHDAWAAEHKFKRMPEFPGGPYILLHTISHLLMQSLSIRCGYPASSIRERIYADSVGKRYGFLLYTASPDAEGTLGGLVHQTRYIVDHLSASLQSASLCANDPICAQHVPDKSIESRFLQGAACHGCVLVSETSCEMRNDYLDRALVTQTLADDHVAFFDAFR